MVKKESVPKAPMPGSIKPMLCTLVSEPFTKEGWLYEVKWDGYRIIAFKKGRDITLRSRSGLPNQQNEPLTLLKR